MDRWVRGALGIHENNHHALKYFFKLVEERNLKNTIEFGTYRGASLLAAALLKDQLGFSRDSVTIGIDSFSGFPQVSEFDSISLFKNLYDANLISQDHFEKVQLNLEIRDRFASGVGVTEISNSSDFSDTSQNLLDDKIKYLKFSHKVETIKLDFSKEIRSLLARFEGILFDGVLIDCDLYRGYVSSLDFCKKKLKVGGIAYLDEYFSLKFPGPRIAVNHFLKENVNEFELVECSDQADDFERWYMVRLK